MSSPAPGRRGRSAFRDVVVYGGCGLFIGGVLTWLVGGCGAILDNV